MKSQKLLWPLTRTTEIRFTKMEATIDKSGRFLIPHEIRKLLGLHPGQRVILSADIDSQTLKISLDHSPHKSDLVIRESGLPLVRNGSSSETEVDTVAMIQQDREEYLDRKMGF